MGESMSYLVERMYKAVRATELLGETPNRRKCFISYYSGDQEEVAQFVLDHLDVMIPRVIGVSDEPDLIDSNDPDYVMSRIRRDYLRDSTVTLCMIGSCTHSRRYIDWELKSSLRRGQYTPNGLIGILLPSMGTSGHLPERLKANWGGNLNEDAGYALYRAYPTSSYTLKSWIDEAFVRRATHSHLIENSQDMFKYNRRCEVHNITH